MRQRNPSVTGKQRSEIAIERGTRHVRSVPVTVSAGPCWVVCLDVARIEGNGKQRVSLRHAGVEQADRDLRVFRRINPARKIGGSRGLLDIGPVHELGGSIPRTAYLSDRIGVHEEASDRDLTAIDQTHFTIREYKPLRLRRDFEALNYGVEGFSMTLPKPDLPPDRFACRGNSAASSVYTDRTAASATL